MTLVGPLRTPGLGEDPEPSAPQAEGVEATLVVATGSTGTTTHPKAFAPTSPDVLLRRGAVNDTEVHLTLERARLDAG